MRQLASAARRVKGGLKARIWRSTALVCFWRKAAARAQTAFRESYLALFGVGVFSQRDCQPRQGRADAETYRACADEHQHNGIRSVAVVDQSRDAQCGDVSYEERKGETDGHSHRSVAGNLQQK